MVMPCILLPFAIIEVIFSKKLKIKLDQKAIILNMPYQITSNRNTSYIIKRMIYVLNNFFLQVVFSRKKMCTLLFKCWLGYAFEIQEVSS